MPSHLSIKERGLSRRGVSIKRKETKVLEQNEAPPPLPQMKYVTGMCLLHECKDYYNLFSSFFWGIPAQIHFLAPICSTTEPKGTGEHKTSSMSLFIPHLWCDEEVLGCVLFTGSVHNHFKHSSFIDWVHTLKPQ